MKIAFVGMHKDYLTIDPKYVRMFNKYHLEIPFYYAQEGGNEVTLVTLNRDSDEESFANGGSFQTCSGRTWQTSPFMRLGMDVVIHWRVIDQWSLRNASDAIHLLHTCDHSYPQDWVCNVKEAVESGRLRGILCYRGWHQRQIAKETGVSLDKLFTDCTLGVDTEIYRPRPEKDPYQMLWSSDPGRGLNDALSLTLRLHQRDKRFRLHICYPDYVRPPHRIEHPAFVWHGNVPNGEKLWDLFGMTGLLPYTSSFQEPSSRAHRQAQAAGSLVLYPPGMGSPSELIEHSRTGLVSPVKDWVGLIERYVKDGSWKEVGRRAREFALTQTWAVQAQNFNRLILRASKG